MSSKFNDVLDSTGEYGKAIIEFEKNGGNPAELLNLFREQRDIVNVDLEDVDNQESVIRAYWESKGEDADWIDDYIETQKDKGLDVFKKDSEKKHARLLEENKGQIQETQRAQIEHKKAQEEALKNFEGNIRKTIYSNVELSKPEQKDLEKFLLNYNNKLPDGRMVNGFLLKMKEIQQDSTKYIKLAKFVQDMDKYEEKISKKAEKEVEKKTYKFLRDSQDEKYTKAAGESPSEIVAKRKDPFALTFK